MGSTVPVGSTSGDSTSGSAAGSVTDSLGEGAPVGVGCGTEVYSGSSPFTTGTLTVMAWARVKVKVTLRLKVQLMDLKMYMLLDLQD